MIPLPKTRIHDGARALDEVKHCQDRMTESMRANDQLMRLTPRSEWTEEQVKQAIAAALHING